jgi:hypothetical protein
MHVQCRNAIGALFSSPEHDSRAHGVPMTRYTVAGLRDLIANRV